MPLPRPRRSTTDITDELRHLVAHRGEVRARISEMSRRITLLSGDAQSDNQCIDRLLGELSATHRAELEAVADRLVQP